MSNSKHHGFATHIAIGTVVLVVLALSVGFFAFVRKSKYPRALYTITSKLTNVLLLSVLLENDDCESQGFEDDESLNAESDQNTDQERSALSQRPPKMNRNSLNESRDIRLLEINSSMNSSMMSVGLSSPRKRYTAFPTPNLNQS